MSNLRRMLISKALLEISAPEYFNFTAYDANGYLEGQMNYSGVPVAYGVGKPTISVKETTDEATGETTIEEHVDFEKNNGLNINPIIWIHYVSKTESSDQYNPANPIPVELKIPKTYNRLPVRKIFPLALYGVHEETGSGHGNPIVGVTLYMPYIIENIDFGNVTDLCAESIYRLERYHKDSEVYEIPNGIRNLGHDAFSGSISYKTSYYTINDSNIQSPGLLTSSKPKVRRIIFGSDLESVAFVHSEEKDGTNIDYGIYKMPHIKSARLIPPFQVNTLVGGVYSEEALPALFSGISTVVIRKECLQLSGLIMTTAAATRPTALVFEHTDTDNIILDITADSKTAVEFTIYTDNTYIKNYDWASKNYTVTFKSLSEYTGEGLTD